MSSSGISSPDELSLTFSCGKFVVHVHDNELFQRLVRYCSVEDATLEGGAVCCR